MASLGVQLLDNTFRTIFMGAAGTSAGGDLPVGVDFDGTNDYLSRSSDLVGNTDSKTFTFSAWVYIPSDGVTTTQSLLAIGYGLQFEIVSGTTIKLRGFKDTTATLLFSVSFTDFPKDTYFNLKVSVDLSDSSNRYVYINERASNQQSWSGTYVNNLIQVSGTPIFSVAANRDGNERLETRLAGVYLDYTYRDLSVEANRRLFIDADGLYVKPPTSGIISVPMDDPDDPGRNDGTGGDFTLNGTVARSGRGPNQYNAVASEFDGSADYLSKTGITSSSYTQLTASFSFSAGGSDDYILRATDGGIQSINIIAEGDFIRCVVKSPSNAQAYRFTLQGAGVIGVHNHISFSLDMSSSTSLVVILNGVNTNTVNDGFVASSTYDIDGIYVGATSQPSNFWAGSLGEFYLDTSYIDLSTENPFYDVETNKPKYLGASGELPTGSSPLIYLPLRADDAGNNLGTGGDFTVNSGPFVGARGASEFIARSAGFSNSNNTYLRTTGIQQSSSKVSFVFYVEVYAGGSSEQYVFKLGQDAQYEKGFSVSLVQGNNITVSANTVNGSLIENNCSQQVPQLSTGNYYIYTVFGAFDFAQPSNNKLFANGGDLSSYMTGSLGTGVAYLYGNSDIDQPYSSYEKEIGHVYLTPDYIDFSQEANRLKFVDAFGYPVDLQPAIDAGDIPTPLIHMKFDDTSALGTNSGSGGDFTVNGTVTSGADVKG
jgi:hypothetical protein